MWGCVVGFWLRNRLGGCGRILCWVVWMVGLLGYCVVWIWCFCVVWCWFVMSWRMCGWRICGVVFLIFFVCVWRCICFVLFLLVIFCVCWLWRFGNWLVMESWLWFWWGLLLGSRFFCCLCILWFIVVCCGVWMWCDVLVGG